jgi:hypothetical protein
MKDILMPSLSRHEIARPATKWFAAAAGAAAAVD